MNTSSPTDHKFYTVREAKKFLDHGGNILLEAVIQDDWIGWVVRIDLPDGSVARMCAKRTALPRIYTKPSYIYTELLELRPTEIKFELTTPELTKIKQFQQDRRALVVDTMNKQEIPMAAMCKQLGVTLATFISILQGERRNPAVESEICNTLGLDESTTFPGSISGFLDIRYELPT